MNKKSFASLCLLCGALTYTSCSSEQIDMANIGEEMNAPNVSYVIPIDSALSNLRRYMSETDNGTRGTGIKEVRNVKPITLSKYTSRMTRSESEEDNIIYTLLRLIQHQF